MDPSPQIDAQEQADAQQDAPPAPPPPPPDPTQDSPTDTAPQPQDATPTPTPLPTTGDVRVRFTVPPGTRHPIMAGGRSWDDNTELDVPSEVATTLLSQPGFSQVNLPA